MLRGDDPSAGDQPDTKAVFDIDTRKLLETARRLRDAGELPSGRKVAGAASFFLGAADNPIDPPPGWKPAIARRQARRRRAIRADAVLHGRRLVRRYVARLADNGLAEQAFAADRHRAAALGEIGDVDPRQVVRRDYSGRRSLRGWNARPIRPRKAAASAWRWCSSFPIFRMSPALTSWRRATTPWCPISSPPPATSVSRLAAV